jgi:hypothetical protein
VCILEVRRPTTKRKERVWDEIAVPEWHDGAAVGDPSVILEGKRQRKAVNYRDKLK